MKNKKSEAANLNSLRRRVGLISTGLLVALSFTLLAFEWRNGELNLEELALLEEGIGDESIGEPVKIHKEEKEPEEKKIRKKAAKDIKVDSNDIEETDVLTLDELVNINIDLMDADEDDGPDLRDSVVITVDEKAEYPGGHKALLIWLNNNIKYPPIPADVGIQGRVFVQFVVEKDGTISSVKSIGKIPHKDLEKEAIKKVAKIPGTWTPGKVNGLPVRSYFKLPVVFRLK